MYIIDKISNDREADMEMLRKDYETAGEREREMIREAAKKIRNESAAVKEMRKELLKAHRRGDKEEIKDIHAFIRNKRKYRNE